MSDYVIGLDIGTGSSKGVLARLDGSVARVTTRSHQMSMPRPGFAEMDAEALWWAEICSMVAELVVTSDGDIAGLCVSGLGPSLVLTGNDLVPLRPAILYGVGTRATSQITEMTERYGAATILNRCGKDLSSPGRRTKNGVGSTERTRRVGQDDSVVQCALLHRGQADRPDRVAPRAEMVEGS